MVGDNGRVREELSSLSGLLPGSLPHTRLGQGILPLAPIPEVPFLLFIIIIIIIISFSPPFSDLELESRTESIVRIRHKIDSIKCLLGEPLDG